MSSSRSTPVVAAASCDLTVTAVPDPNIFFISNKLPSTARTPLRRIPTLFAIRSTSFSICVHKIIVEPEAASPLMISMTSARPSGSSADVGSSRINRSGFAYNAAAIPIRWIIPREYPFRCLRALPYIPVNSSTSAVRSLILPS
jgi:hypothetical protein